MPPIAASVSYWAMLIIASVRVATGGSVTSRWMAARAMLFHPRIASDCDATMRVSVTCTGTSDTLPAASVIVMLNAFTPPSSSDIATLGSWKVPAGVTRAVWLV